MGDVLYIVVPCYNEEAVLPETQKELGNKLETMITAGAVSEKSRIIFVDDGSKDKTWELIENITVRIRELAVSSWHTTEVISSQFWPVL